MEVDRIISNSWHTIGLLADNNVKSRYALNIIYWSLLMTSCQPDPTPENGMYYRSDHFNFARAGVPALFINQGFDHVTKGREWLLSKNQQWTAQCYHKPKDKIVLDPTDEWCWDLAGAVDDVRYDVSQFIILVAHY
jgi:Zn-dependent M28 family amino/carboxypeptidase